MRNRGLLLALALFMAFAPVAYAQLSGGNVYGTVKDESGAVLPGANIALAGAFGSRSTVTGADGAFRFLSLDKGEYTLTLSLTGFAKTVRKVRVSTGENVELQFAMKISQMEETVTVTGETPLVEIKKRGTATTMTTEELSQIPTARDPWGVLKSVPGVLVDRVNIAGNENGQQASSSAKGAVSDDNTWNIDGLVITDMSATGASPSYFDFGAFQEITITTGGTDLTMQTGGAGINLVTKRGGNSFHGSARFLVAHDKLSRGNVKDQDQSPYRYPSLGEDPRLQNADGSFRDKGDHIQQITEWGVDVGGPIIKDKLWFYGTYGKQDIRMTRMNNTPDKTLLPSVNGKLNWQATSNTMVSVFYFNGMKEKYGRSPGSGLVEENGVLFDQKNAYKEGGMPGGLWKLQVDQTFSSNFFASLKLAYYDTGFTFATRGDSTGTATYDYYNGTLKGTGWDYLAVRPMTSAVLDGNYFFRGLGGGHELKFGFQYRKVTTESSTTWPGNQLVGGINDPTDKYALLYRSYTVNYHGVYTSAYVGDVYTKDRLSVNIGARFDRQTAGNDASSATANVSFPNVLPTATYPGGDDIVKWNTISPRVGLAYAFDEARKTVLRASYSRYYQQLSFGNVTAENPTGYSYLGYGWVDSNGDGFVQPGEVNFSDFRYSSGVDPNNPSALSESVSKIDRDLVPKHDDEIVVGVDREVAGNFAVGLAFTYRKAANWQVLPFLAAPCSSATDCVVITPDQYTQNAPVSSTVGGVTYTTATYSPPSALVDAGSGGYYRTNRPNYSTQYMGLELTANKRLSNKWMARVAFSYNDWKRKYNGASLVANPTPYESESFIEGDQVSIYGTGSGKKNFYSSFQWQIYANALYQLPWSFDISAALFGRQGGLEPLYIRTSAGRSGSINALYTNEKVTDHRYPNVFDLDLRLAKTIKFGKTNLQLAAEWFNVLNAGTNLQANRQLNASSYGQIVEVLSPNILRLGATFSF